MFLADQIADDWHGAARVEDVNHRLAVSGRNFHRSMSLAGRRTADEQWQFQSFALHLTGHVSHFIERRRDESAQADDVHVLFAGGL